jgi:hypothetical protein
MTMVTSQADCLWLGTADTNLLFWREEDPFVVAKMHGHEISQGSIDGLMGSCSQNTLKHKRLEYWIYG